MGIYAMHKSLIKYIVKNTNFGFDDLMKKLQLKQSTLSNHISKLKEYGIIYTLNKGGFIELRLNKIILKKYLCDDFFKPYNTIQE